MTVTSGQKEDIENSSVEFHMTVIPKTHFLGKRQAVPFNHRYSSHLQVIECPNKRTFFEIDKGWAYDFWFL